MFADFIGQMICITTVFLTLSINDQDRCIGRWFDLCVNVYVFIWGNGVKWYKFVTVISFWFYFLRVPSLSVGYDRNAFWEIYWWAILSFYERHGLSLCILNPYETTIVYIALCWPVSHDSILSDIHSNYYFILVIFVWFAFWKWLDMIWTCVFSCVQNFPYFIAIDLLCVISYFT